MLAWVLAQVLAFMMALMSAIDRQADALLGQHAEASEVVSDRRAILPHPPRHLREIPVARDEQALELGAERRLGCSTDMSGRHGTSHDSRPVRSDELDRQAGKPFELVGRRHVAIDAQANSGLAGGGRIGRPDHDDRNIGDLPQSPDELDALASDDRIVGHDQIGQLADEGIDTRDTVGTLPDREARSREERHETGTLLFRPAHHEHTEAGPGRARFTHPLELFLAVPLRPILRPILRLMKIPQFESSSAESPVAGIRFGS